MKSQSCSHKKRSFSSPSSKRVNLLGLFEPCSEQNRTVPAAPRNLKHPERMMGNRIRRRTKMNKSEITSKRCLKRALVKKGQTRANYPKNIKKIEPREPRNIKFAKGTIMHSSTSSGQHGNFRKQPLSTVCGVQTASTSQKA